VLAVELFDAVIALHIASVVIAFGFVFAYPLMFGWARARQPALLGPMHAMQERLKRYLQDTFATLVGVTGVYLAIDADLWDRIWVQVPIVLWVGTGIIALYSAPNEKRAAELAADPQSTEYRALSGRLQRIALVNCLLVLVAIFFMVAKPGGYA